MKKMIVAGLLAAATMAAGPLTRGERDRAMSSLHATRKMFLDAISGLSGAQWKFKPAPDRWSIAECAEHITLSEDSLFQLITGKILAGPATPEKNTARHRALDEDVLRVMAERSIKAEAPSSLEPAGKWNNREALIAEFKKLRDRTIAYVRDTDDELRDHFMKGPNSMDLDAYQWLLLISAHTERHVRQIREIQSLPGYPGN